MLRKSSCTPVHCGFLIFASLEIPPFGSTSQMSFSERLTLYPALFILECPLGILVKLFSTPNQGGSRDYPSRPFLDVSDFQGSVLRFPTALHLRGGYRVASSTSLSRASARPAAFLPPAVAKPGWPPPPPWISFAASLTSVPALRPFLTRSSEYMSIS